MLQFPLYSNKVKTILNLSQSSLTTIASFKNLGAATGFLSGPLFGVFPAWLVIGLSALFNFIGHLFIHLVVSQSISTPKAWRVYLAALGGALQVFLFAAAIVVSHNFSKIKSLLKSNCWNQGTLHLLQRVFYYTYKKLYWCFNHLCLLINFVFFTLLISGNTSTVYL